MKVLEALEAKQLIPFTYQFVEMPDSIDGTAKYIHEHNVFLVSINSNKGKYPYETSRDRRLNFTIAHEIGHIALEHVLSTAEKTKEQEDYENLEADEFTARFLMPEALLFSLNYYHIASAAEYLMVSQTALWKRLNNMKRLDLFHSRRVNTCEK